MKAKSRERRTTRLRSKKAGLPPGSLVHIGEVKVEEARLTLIDYGPSGLVELDIKDAESLRAYQRRHEKLWINLYGLHNVELLKAVGDFCRLHPLAIEDVLNTEQRPKLDDYGDTLYVALHRHSIKHGEPVTDQISIAIGKDFVFSAQECPSGVMEPVRQRLRQDRGNLRGQGTDYLAYSLLDAVVDSLFSVVETLGDTVDDIEDIVLGQSPPETQQRLHALGRQANRLRRNLWPLREVLGALQHIAHPLVSPGVQPYLRDVQDHVVYLVESLDDLREVITGLQAVFLSKVSHRLNLELRALTVIATIFMPATLIAGVFGMNFRYMPWLDSPDGFDRVMELMAMVAGVMLLIFWRRRLISGRGIFRRAATENRASPSKEGIAD